MAAPQPMGVNKKGDALVGADSTGPASLVKTLRDNIELRERLARAEADVEKLTWMIAKDAHRMARGVGADGKSPVTIRDVISRGTSTPKGFMTTDNEIHLRAIAEREAHEQRIRTMENEMAVVVNVLNEKIDKHQADLRETQGKLKQANEKIAELERLLDEAKKNEEELLRVAAKGAPANSDGPAVGRDGAGRVMKEGAPTPATRREDECQADGPPNNREEMWSAFDYDHYCFMMSRDAVPSGWVEDQMRRYNKEYQEESGDRLKTCMHSVLISLKWLRNRVATARTMVEYHNAIIDAFYKYERFIFNHFQQRESKRALAPYVPSPSSVLPSILLCDTFISPVERVKRSEEVCWITPSMPTSLPKTFDTYFEQLKQGRRTTRSSRSAHFSYVPASPLPQIEQKAGKNVGGQVCPPSTGDKSSSNSFSNASCGPQPK